MENKPSDSNSQNICEKLCNCLTSPFRSFRRNSHSLQEAAPGEKEREEFPVFMPIQDGHEGKKVAPKTESEPEQTLFQVQQKIPKKTAEVAPVVETVMGSGQGEIITEGEPPQETTGKKKELRRTGTEVMNDNFTDYIGRTKLKIRSMSSFSGGKSSSFK